MPINSPAVIAAKTLHCLHVNHAQEASINAGIGLGTAAFFITGPTAGLAGLAAGYTVTGLSMITYCAGTSLLEAIPTPLDPPMAGPPVLARAR